MANIPGNPDNLSTFGREEMANIDLPANSYSKKSEAKPEETPTPKKKVEKVVQGGVIKKKKGVGSKIAETFTGDDARSVGSYVLFDVIIPAAKNMIADSMSQGTERLLFGDSRSRSKISGGSRTYRSYGSMYKRPEERNGKREMSRKARNTHDFDEIVIEERGEAEEVIDQLVQLIEDFGQAKVTDLYDLVGITGSYTDDKWGWVDLRSAGTTRVRAGYMLELPKPIVLD